MVICFFIIIPLFCGNTEISGLKEICISKERSSDISYPDKMDYFCNFSMTGSEWKDCKSQ